jgi:hypothetical protein
MPIPKRIINRVNDEIETTFQRLRTRFFAGGDKQLRIGWSPYEGLSGLYRMAAEAAGGEPDKETEQGLLEIASSYLEGVKSRLRSDVLSTIGAYAKDPDPDPEELSSQLATIWDKATTEVERVVDTESQRARQVGSLDGISQASAAMGVDDPTVFWVVVRDARLCGECKRLHLLPSGKPRLWKLSQVGSEYHTRGDDVPKHAGLHPHCRCTLTFLPPGFGFDGGGMVKWIGPGHDEYAAQQE